MASGEFGKWIAVSDELPKVYDTPVLGYDEFYGQIGLVIFQRGRLVFERVDDCSISHWMSLPEPPKGANNANR